MAVSRVQTSSIVQGFPKSRSLLAGNSAYVPPSFESIATYTVGSGGVTNVEFTGIANTWKHLQIRFFVKPNASFHLGMQFNSDTASNYSRHRLWGSGSSPLNVEGSANTSYMEAMYINYNDSTTTGAGIIDVLDYANTSKYKTIRNLHGSDFNGGGRLEINSGNWRSTSAVTSIKFYTTGSETMNQYTQFALYGIKG
jgi:hypothetical protein